MTASAAAALAPATHETYDGRDKRTRGARAYSRRPPL